MRASVINDLRIPSDWGLEVGVLSEMKRNYATNRVCQVDIADIYDHKHQELSLDDRQKGLSRIVWTLLKLFLENSPPMEKSSRQKSSAVLKPHTTESRWTSSTLIKMTRL